MTGVLAQLVEHGADNVEAMSSILIQTKLSVDTHKIEISIRTVSTHLTHIAECFRSSALAGHLVFINGTKRVLLLLLQTHLVLGKMESISP